MTADEICVHLRDLSRVLRANGIDPNSPDAVRDLDRRLRGQE